MKLKTLGVRSVFLGTLLLVAVPTFAHHSFAMFDYTKTITYVGTVVQFRWENPHSHIIIKVVPGAADASTVGTWDIEGNSINIMARQGWSKLTCKPGDKITLVAHPLKSGEKGASLSYIILPDGTRLYTDVARPKPDADSEKPPQP